MSDSPEVRVVKLTEELQPKVLSIRAYEDQNRFFPDIESSLELALRYRNAQPLAVLTGETVCGFALYGIDYETKKWKVFRLVIDKEFQNKGVGTRAMTLILEMLRNEHNATEILLVVDDENAIAQNLYEKLGFTRYDTREDKLLMKISSHAAT